MRWADVLTSLEQFLPHVAELAAIYGPENIRLSGEVEYVKPNLLELTLISDTLADEVWNPCIVQFDQFCDSMNDLRASESILRKLLHHDFPVDLFGVYMWSEVMEGVELASPASDGYFGRGVRFRFTPLRSEYVPVV